MADKSAPSRLYLVDGTAQLFRAYFALGRLSNDEGLPTNAVYGFTAMLRKLVEEERPDLIGVAFDPPGPVFRNEAFADYKANRPPMPEDLKLQFPYAKQVCEVLRVPVLELEGFEADDVIATMSRQGRAAGHEVVVVASDKDLLQLVGDGIEVLDPSKNLRLDPAGVVESFGVAPERVLDVQGLMGDSVDNIPGVPGVGRKTAIQAVSTYGDLESVIARAARFVGAYEARNAVVAAIEAASSESELSPASVEAVGSSTALLAEALDRLIEIELDASLRGRYAVARELLDGLQPEALISRIGEKGRQALKPWAPLKRELKALDRGSSRKIWFAVEEYADQARLSRRLATLRTDVPLEFDEASLAASAPDREAAHALFTALGFRRLTAEFESNAGSQGPSSPGAEVSAADVVTSESGLRELVERCREAGGFAVSLFADGDDPLRAPLIGIALAPKDAAPGYLPLRHDYLGAPDQLSEATLCRHLDPILSGSDSSRTTHDVKRAVHLLRRMGIVAEDWKLDTMVAAFLLNPGAGGYGLRRIAAEFLGRETPSLADFVGSGAKRRAAGALEVEAAAGFNVDRAATIEALAGTLEDRLGQAGLDELYRTVDGPLLPLLARMETTGIRVDTLFLEAMSVEMDVELERGRAEIHELAGETFNVDSPKQIREVLFDKLGLKSRRKTAKSGAASTDAQTLEELVDQHPIAAKILEYRGLAKLKSTYVDSLPRLVHKETGRVHTHYDPTGAATGRLSSRDPNLQNIPVRSATGRRIRQAFVPADGFVFLASDYSQIELRVLAHLTKDPGLVSAFRAGEDIHSHTASKIFGVLPALVTDEMRRRAKAINFGLLYGMSETRLAREQGIKRTDARRFVEAYFTRFAGVRAYIDGVREQALRDSAVRTLFGRVRYFPQLHAKGHRGLQEQALRGAVNTTVQGTAADLMKIAMLRVDESLTAAGLEARILLQVHDELLLEVRQGEEDAVGDLVRQAMEGAHPLEVPLVVDQKIGGNWMEVT